MAEVKREVVDAAADAAAGETVCAKVNTEPEAGEVCAKVSAAPEVGELCEVREVSGDARGQVTSASGDACGQVTSDAPVRIAVVDYCKGNLRSVERGLCRAGADAFITASLDDIAAADAIVLPGVGSFADAATTMTETGQMALIRERVQAGVPFLGICLGLHLMFEEGEEGAEDGVNPRGLGLLPGCARALPRTDAQGTSYKVPHVGWNTIDFNPDTAPELFEGINPGEYFYFTHSFIAPDGPATCARTAHSVEFPCVCACGERAFGMQFHPEKSSDAGATLLSNFVRLVRNVKGM